MASLKTEMLEFNIMQKISRFHWEIIISDSTAVSAVVDLGFSLLSSALFSTFLNFPAVFSSVFIVFVVSSLESYCIPVNFGEETKLNVYSVCFLLIIMALLIEILLLEFYVLFIFLLHSFCRDLELRW